jgi:hypothetical protein
VASAVRGALASPHEGIPMLMKKLAGGAALCVLAFAATGAFAQEITGGIAGTVTENGKAIGGAQVKVTNPGTGQSFTTTSGPDGFYTVRNLQPGGPYNITVTAPDKQTASDTVGQVPIGAPVQLDMPVGATASEVTVTASPIIRNLTVATGPRTIITQRDIQELPSFARDLHDLVRLNPFVTIDEANSNSLIIAGTNNHFNTIYLDGVRQSDDFGLNNNGYPTQRTPFSLGIVQSLNLEVAPYDVQYGDFEGGVVNVVTKSGTNQFHGSVQYEYDSSGESGKFIGPDAIYAGVEGLRPLNAQPRQVTTVFQDQDSAVTIGGPLWPDHMFFFFGYDKFQGAGSSSFVPQDVAGSNPITGVLQSDVTQVQGIFKASAPGGYSYDPLNFGGSAPLLNTDYFAKFDWYITDKQHFWFTYQNTQGTSYNTPDASVSSKELNLASSDYVFAQDLTAYTGDLTSNWTPNLATEVEFTYRDVESPTQNVGAPFANVLISNLPNGGQIDLGPDISRQANNLGVKDMQARFRAHYTIGDNVITAGYEWEQLSEFDLFVQDATGAYTFNNTCGPGLGQLMGVYTNLNAHVACKLTYQNAFDNNPNTAAGTAFFYTNTLYAEDEWHPNSDLTVTGGLRAEFYSSPSKPQLNPRFVAQYGFDNNLTIDGEYIVMPRVGFNWRPNPGLTVTGGVGLFSGGNPGVYTYDSFDNPGNLLGLKTYTCSVANCATAPTALTGAGSSALVGVTGSSIPLAVQQDITNSAKLGTGTANALAPGFKPPSQWKASLSVVQVVDFNDYRDSKWGKYTAWLGDGWRFHGDLLGTKTQDAVFWQDIWALQNTLTPAEATALGIPSNVAPDGRPLFNPNRYLATPPGTPAGTTRTSGSDILLTETHQGDGVIFAIGAEKSFNWGLDVDYTFTHENVRDVNPATSSVANSNYINNITADPNHPTLSTSNYQILYQNRLAFTYVHKWLGDNNTTIRLFLVNRAGLPFSYAFCPTASSACGSPQSANFDELFGQASSTTMHQLLYVPTANASGQVTLTSDPKVTYGAGFDITDFNNFLHTTGLLKYAGQIAPRNAFRSSDVNTADIHFGQELPALFPNGAKGEVYFDIINLLNLLNKNWGIDNQVSFPYVFAPISAINCQFSGLVLDKVTMPVCAHGQGNFYQFNTFRPQVTSTGSNQFSTIQTLGNPPVPTWVIKFGVRYKF